MRLDIYDKKGKVVKTCEKDVNELLFGTIDDVSRALDLKPGDKYSTQEITDIVTAFIDSDMDGAKEIIANIFDDVTAEEIRMTKFTDLMRVIVEVIGYTIGALGKVKAAGDEKN